MNVVEYIKQSFAISAKLVKEHRLKAYAISVINKNEIIERFVFRLTALCWPEQDEL